MWLLASVTPVTWVERTPSFKEKRRNQPDDVNHALLTYPVLQTADIAIYNARYVPVGKDQAAHLELAREIVRAFNTVLRGHLRRAPGGVHRLAHRPGHGWPGQDVQVPGQHHRHLRGRGGRSGSRSWAWSRTRSACDGPTRVDPRCATCASSIACSARTTTSRSGRASARHGPVAWTPSGCSPTGCSTSFAEARERRRELEARPGYVEEILRAGAERLAPLAAETMRICHDVMGLGPRR